ncbi:MAG: ankyrin repeat domain-containing protein [Candidatus Hydrogenedentes bacterium]|nr:ankyrin repeat domain-containing protein [Candidatus Hydrogenedentota bacterium]
MFRRSFIFTIAVCAALIATGCDKSKSEAVKPTFAVEDLPAEEQIYEYIQQGNLAKVQEIVAGDPATLTAPGVGGQTPLHVAAAEGKADIAQFLVESGCDVNAPDDFGQTPIDVAKTGGQTAVLKVLEAGGSGGGEAQ